MGKKERIVELELDVEYLTLELEAARADAAEWRNKAFDHNVEISDLQDEIDLLESVIIDLNVQLFGVKRELVKVVEQAAAPNLKGDNLKVICEGAGLKAAPVDRSWIRFE